MRKQRSGLLSALPSPLEKMLSFKLNFGQAACKDSVRRLHDPCYRLITHVTGTATCTLVQRASGADAGIMRRLNDEGRLLGLVAMYRSSLDRPCFLIGRRQLAELRNPMCSGALLVASGTAARSRPSVCSPPPPLASARDFEVAAPDSRGGAVDLISAISGKNADCREYGDDILEDGSGTGAGDDDDIIPVD